MARNAGLLILVVAVAVAGCGGAAHTRVQTTSQAVRTCADRWNQDNMVGYRYDAGQAELAILPVGQDLASYIAGKPHDKRCLLMLGPRRSAPVYCILGSDGAFFCPYSPMTGPRRTAVNATLERDGTLKLLTSLAGTHVAKPLPWQRYPHVDSYIHPWTASGRLRPGLRLKSWKLAHGPCTQGSEEIPDPTAITCILAMGRTGPCYPQKRHWGPGDIAACGGAGTTFTRWRITGR